MVSGSLVVTLFNGKGYRNAYDNENEIETLERVA